MFTSANSRRRALGAGLACALLGGCAVGPDFVRPAPPHLDRYPTQPPAGGADAVAITPAGATDAAWWRDLGSPALDALVQAGLKDSPSLASARAALDQSRAQARAGAGVFFPGLSAAGSGVREKTAPIQEGQAVSGSTFSLYTLSGSISYPLDLFGGERRSLEALKAQAEAQRQALGAARLLLTGNIVDAAVAQAGYRDQAAALAEIVRLETEQKALLQAQARSGSGPLSAALAAEGQLAADRESLALARQRAAAASSLLHALLGLEPGEAAPSAPDLDALQVPAAAPASLPSQLVHQRPDILQAEAVLHQSSAQVGVATAALFPSISLTGDYGAASTRLARLSGPMGRFWSIGPSIDAPVFRGGALWFGRRAAQAAYRKSAADYRQTVLSALEQVDDQLRALEADGAVNAASRAALEAAALNQALGEANLKAGVIGDLDAIDLRLTAQRARLEAIAAKAQALQDLVGLHVACGGGWDGRDGGSGPAAVAGQ